MLGIVLSVLLAVSLLPGTAGAADGYLARFVQSQGRTYTFALDYPELKESYPINVDEMEEDDLEYAWGFRFTDGAQVYEVMTSHFKYGEPETASLYDMQTNLWKQDSDDEGFHVIDECALKIENTTLYWTFTMPEDVDVSNLRIIKTMVRYLGDNYYNNTIVDLSGSGVGSGTEDGKLAPPQNVRWETDGEGNGYPGYFYWEPSASDTEDTDSHLEYLVEVYRGSECVYQVGWSARGTEKPFRVASFLWEPHESGQYRFSVTLEDWGDESRNSDPVWSDVWTYDNPGVYLSVPYGLHTEGNTLIWQNDSSSDFQNIEWDFSEEENSEKRDGGSSWATVNNTADLSKVTKSFRLGDGWYHFQVRNLSRDIRAACPSDWSEYLSVQVVDGAAVSDSGSSGGGTSKLAAPSNLHWETASRQCTETWNGRTHTVDVLPGWFSWDASGSDTGAERLTYDINMYCGEEKVDHHTWSATGSRDSFHIGVFLTKPHESGQYRYSIQLIDRNDRSRDSDLVWSDVWTYTNPGVSLPVPGDLSAEGAVVTWTATGKCAAKWYYSTEENGAEEYSLSYWSLTPPIDLSVETDNFQYGDGYYHVRVKDLGNDITQICPSDWSEYLTLHVVNGAVVSSSGGSGESSFTVIDSGNRTDPITKESIQYETRSNGSVAVSGNVSPTAPVLVATYNENGQMTGVTQLTEPGTADISGGDTATLFWLGENSVPKCESVPIK